MFSNKASAVLIGLLSIGAFAAPAFPVNGTNIDCGGDWYLVEKWGVISAQPSYNGFGAVKGCKTVSEVFKRDEGSSRIEVTDAKAGYARVKNLETGQPDASPDVFMDLWGRIAAELCGETFCQEAKTISQKSNYADGDEVVITAAGSFTDVRFRDNYIALAKDAFFKGVTGTETSLTTNYEGPGYLHGTSTFDSDAAKSWITIQVFNVKTGDGITCPSVVNTINSFGALVPELAPVFGFASAFCTLLG